MRLALFSLAALLLTTLGTARSDVVPEGKSAGKSKLGRSATISLGVRHLSSSRAFFECLGFKVLDGRVGPAGAELHDGVVTVGLGCTRGEPSLVVTYVVNDFAETEATLKAAGVEVVRGAPLGAPFGFTDPNGLRVWFMATKLASNPKPARSTAKCGTFGELAVPTKDLKASVSFWQRLGFRQIGGAAQPYPFSILTDGLIVLGFHQSNDFEVPHLTYYSPDVKRRIAALKKDGFRFLDENKDDRGEVNGGTLVSPDGHRIFVFAK